ncbi:eukaryotic and archaeal DNA primase, large subunit-domain-containing protein [Zopfochytrium polystomum]|nr:eukaryotic and archaeal DNA primase, large subunit-domain-containing protein [Zopfochytrium polystomum]
MFKKSRTSGKAASGGGVGGDLNHDLLLDDGIAGIAGGDPQLLALFASHPLLSRYPTALCPYTSPPRAEITVDDFELWALDRLKVLRAIDAAAIRSKAAASSNSTAAASAAATAASLKPLLDKHLRLTPNSLAAAAGASRVANERLKDHCSHYILRLAYCRTEDNRAWFLRTETALFRARFEAEPAADRDAFLRRHAAALGCDAADSPPAELRAIQGELAAVHGADVAAAAVERRPGTRGGFYKVPFERVAGLVARRAVVVAAGFAYVPDAERPLLVAHAFRERLRDALEATARAMPRMDEDDRLAPVLNSIARQLATGGYDPNNTAAGAGAGTIRAAEVNRLAKEGHFPPCMLHMQTHLAANSHLKHTGRLQFSLFLKGAGLPLDEALVYWRKAFSKLTDDQFSKAYAYNVRFNYGREGSRRDYAPHSCQRIIMEHGPNAAAGEAHGCPFRHLSGDAVRGICGRLGVAEGPMMGEVLALAKDGHAQIACTRVFEMVRGPAVREARRALAAAAAAEGGSGDALAAAAAASAPFDIIEHPNQWFDMSYRLTSRKTAAPRQTGEALKDGAALEEEPAVQVDDLGIELDR